ncbi:MAG TPA: efflux RND transporter periplasmic adaptor subunit [Pseudobdellovibrionaceae bacterium]|nr:efflux RND transporter periplasmic adaptor subunit [Pseudobdellovibrionaceae bacterium]
MTRNSKRIWIGLGIAAFLSIGLSAVYLLRPAKEETPREFVLKKGNIEVSILATGEVKPENRLEIKPPLAGRIDEVLVREGQSVKAGQVLAWMSSNERAALLDAARAKGEEEVKYWENLYRPIPIVAPLAGTLIYRNVESGQTFDTGVAIFAMSDRLLIKAQVDETDLAQIKLKQRTRVVLDAYPKEPMGGQVHKISYESKMTNNVTTYTVDILTDEIPAFMRSGMTANVAFILDSKKDVLTIPAEAIIHRGEAQFAVVKVGDKATERRIETGLSDGKTSEVLQGLSEGDVVLAPRLSTSSEGRSSRNPFGFGGAPPRGGGRR